MALNMDFKKVVLAGLAFFLMTAVIAAFYVKGDDVCEPNVQMAPQVKSPQEFMPQKSQPARRSLGLKRPYLPRRRSSNDFPLFRPGSFPNMRPG